MSYLDHHIELGTPEYHANDPIFGENIVKLPVIIKDPTPSQIDKGFFTMLSVPGYQHESMFFYGFENGPGHTARFTEEHRARIQALHETGDDHGWIEKPSTSVADGLIKTGDLNTGGYVRHYHTDTHGEYIYAYKFDWSSRYHGHGDIVPESDGSDGRYILTTMVFKLLDSAPLNGSYKFVWPDDTTDHPELFRKYHRDYQYSIAVYARMASYMSQGYFINYDKSYGRYGDDPYSYKITIPSAIRTVVIEGEVVPDPLVAQIDGNVVVSADRETQRAEFQVTAAGGTKPYAYLWENGETLQGTVLDISELPTGESITMSCAITDADGQTVTKMFSVEAADITDPDLTLLPFGDSVNIVLEAGSPWPPSFDEYSVSDDEDIDVNVSINPELDEIDPLVPGTTEVVYTAIDDSGNETKRTRLVTFVDTLPPVITILGPGSTIAEPLEIEFGGSYVEYGADASDSIDQDVVANPSQADVKAIQDALASGKDGSFTVSYMAIDASGNVASAERYIELLKKPDTIKPILRGTGDGFDKDSPLVICRTDDAEYSDEGATAEDEDADGNISDISKSIEVSGAPVDLSEAGDYQITYNVKDSAGNAADELIRYVKVVECGGLVRMRMIG